MPPGTIAYATVNLPEDIDFTRASEIGKEIRDLIPEVDGLRVELGGFLFAEFEQPSAELFGLAFAIIILIVAFGSVIAMGLPVAVGLFGIGMGGAFVILASHLMEVPDFAPFVGVMIGLGVGIDYALLIVTRYREQLHAGYDVRESVAIAMDTAGRSVLFAGATVVISLLGMLLMGIGFVGGLGITASLTVAFTVIASLTLLPALLGFAGEKIERTKWRGLVAAGFVAIGLAGRGPQDSRARRRRLRARAAHDRARVRRRAAEARGAAPAAEAAPRDGRVPVEPRHPAPAVDRDDRGGGRAALPRRSRCSSSASGSPTRATSPTTPRPSRPTTSIVDGFGKGSTGPIYLVAPVDDAEQVGALAAVNDAVAADPDVEAVLGPQPNDPENPTAVRWFVTPQRRPAGRVDDEARRAPALRRAPVGRGVDGHRRARQRLGRRQRRHVGLHGRADADLLRRRADAVVPAAHARVPVAARAAEGRDHEPAVDRRGVRRDHRACSSGAG